MTPGFAWALTVVLSFGAGTHPVPTWHATQEACERQREIEATRHQLAGRPVEWMGCQRIRVVGR